MKRYANGYAARLKTEYGENVPQKELTNNRMYGSKVRTYGNIWTIKRWGEA